MPIQIDCPACGGSKEVVIFTDGYPSGLKKCNCKDGKITVYTDTEYNKLVIRVKDIEEGIKGYKQNNNHYHQILNMVLTQEDITILELKKTLMNMDNKKVYTEKELNKDGE